MVLLWEERTYSGTIMKAENKWPYLEMTENKPAISLRVLGEDDFIKSFLNLFNIFDRAGKLLARLVFVSLVG